MFLMIKNVFFLGFLMAVSLPALLFAKVCLDFCFIEENEFEFEFLLLILLFFKSLHMRSFDSLGDNEFIKRSFDSLGNHEFIRRYLDSLGDHEFIKRRAFDSLGNHEFIKRLDTLGKYIYIYCFFLNILILNILCTFMRIL